MANQTDWSQRCAVILAGGEGLRLRPLTRRIAGDERPKQFCALVGPETLLAQTRRRVGLAVSPARTALVVTQAHQRFYTPLLADAPGACVVVQAKNVGTAPAILYSMIGSLTAVGLVLLGLLSPSLAGAESALRTGTIILGVPRVDFVVLGADRFWSNALPRLDDTLAERQGRQVKIALHAWSVIVNARSGSRSRRARTADRGVTGHPGLGDPRRVLATCVRVGFGRERVARPIGELT